MIARATESWHVTFNIFFLVLMNISKQKLKNQVIFYEIH